MPGTQFTELLFNPVERIVILRACEQEHPNAIRWDAKPKGSTFLSRIFYAVMDWEEDYSFRIRCQPITGPDEETVLAFDLDNYIGRASSKKDEVIVARKETQLQEGFSQNSRSYFFPPDEPEEAIELTKEDEVTIPPEQFYGRPAFTSSTRAIRADGEWDFMIPTRELDHSHVSDPEHLQALLSEIRRDPPEAPQPRQRPGMVIEADIKTERN